MQKILFIARKEVYHILRDVRSLLIVFAMPVLMTFMYGYAINLDIENVALAVIDHDHTFESRELTNRFYGSAYFSRPTVAVDERDYQAIFRSGDATAILFIQPGFAQSLLRNEQQEIGLTIDGSDATLAAAVQAYAEGVLMEYLIDRLPPGTQLPGIQISRQVLYNPDLQSAHFFVPGLVAVILLMISALLTSVTIAREKEMGTMEGLLTAPVTPKQIIIGKLLPYLIIAFFDGILVLVFAKILFNVPFLGSPLLLLAFGFIYIATALAFGILISALVKTQQIAMLVTQSATLLPSVMLSGFIFAIKNMPIPLQAISYIVPARYFVVIIRGIMLKGAGLGALAIHGGALLLITFLVVTIASRKFESVTG